MCRDGADDANTDDECAVLAQTTQTQTTCAVLAQTTRTDDQCAVTAQTTKADDAGAVMAPTSFSISHALSISLGVKTEWCQHVSAGGSARGREGTRGHYALTHTHTH